MGGAIAPKKSGPRSGYCRCFSRAVSVAFHAAVERFGGHDLDAEACEPDIRELARREQADRRDAEVFEDLCAEPDFAPLPRARNLRAGGARLRNGVRRDAGGAVAQED